MGIGHEGTKIYKEWQKQVVATALFQIYNVDSWLFSSPCNSTSLVLKIRGTERYGVSPQKAREGDKIRHSTLRLVSHLSKFGLVSNI